MILSFLNFLNLTESLKILIKSIFHFTFSFLMFSFTIHQPFLSLLLRPLEVLSCQSLQPMPQSALEPAQTRSIMVAGYISRQPYDES